MTTLRAANEARCERILQRSGLLESADLDWDRVGRAPLRPEVVDVLVYMRDVEGFTNRELVGLIAHPSTLADPVVAAFLELWRAEEHEHARAIDRYLSTYAARLGVALPPTQVPPPSLVPVHERALLLVSRPIGHLITAAHMLWGTANEMLTTYGYRLMAHRCDEPVLSELLTRISAQEARHYSFYRLQAEWRLADSRLARLALRAMMRRSWTPVGIGDGYKSPEEWDRVLTYLAGDHAGARAIDAMDGAFTRLPGFEGMRIFRRSLAESRARLAA